MENTRKNPPTLLYVIGGMSFIPLIGFFLGIITIIIGIIFYSVKNTKAIPIFLGIGGMMFTIILYSSLYYFGFVQRGGVFDDLRKNLDRQCLTMLVKEIELYKVTHGSYPETLYKLDSTNRTVSITDPILKQISKKKNDTIFYYQLVNDGYYLFSVGYDLNAFTKDDIFPVFTNVDTTHFGYKTPK